MKLEYPIASPNSTDLKIVGFVTADYVAGGKALLMVMQSEEEGVSAERLSVFLEGQMHHLGKNEFFIKNWSEYESLYPVLLQHRIVCPTGRYASSGYVSAPICRLLINPLTLDELKQKNPDNPYEMFET